LAKAEIKAREQILEPAAAQAASKSQEIIARAEQQAEAILSGVKQLFGRGSDAANPNDSSSVDGPEADDDGTTSEGLPKPPPIISRVQRDQLDAANPNDSSSVDGPEAAADGTTSEGLPKPPPIISRAQRNQLRQR
jgi:hypothetical protein